MKNINIDTVKTGQNLKKYRRRKGLKVESVYKRLGLACPQSVYKWERGECLPRIDNFFALCYLYGVSPKDLLCFYDSDYETHIYGILKEKNEPKKPIPLDKWGEYYKCPVCGKYAVNDFGCKYKFCSNCGTEFDWSNSK